VGEAAALHELLAFALGQGAAWAEVFFEDTLSRTVRLRDGMVSTGVSTWRRGVAVRVLRGDTVGSASTSDLSAEGLRQAVLLASAGSAPFSPPPAAGSGLVAPLPVAGRPEPATAQAACVELLHAAADAACSAPGIRQARLSLSETRRRVRVLASPGPDGPVDAGDEQLRTSLSVECVAAEAGTRERAFAVLARRAGADGLDQAAVRRHAGQVAGSAVGKLRARPAPAGRLPVVFAAGAGGKLFHEVCGHGLEGDSVLARASVFAGRLGCQVAVPGLHLVDDGTYPDGWASASVDDEGRPARRLTLIDDGRLEGYLWDAMSARRAGQAASASGRRQGYRHQPLARMSNTFVLPGPDDPDEIVAQTRFGVLCRRLSGGSVNPATADFVFGMAEGHLIEGGRVTTPLREANLVGNGLDVLGRVDALGSDFATGVGTCGKEGQSVPVSEGNPTLRVGALTVGGRSRLSPA